MSSFNNINKSIENMEDADFWNELNDKFIQWKNDDTNKLSRKDDAIKLLNYLIKLYETDDSLEDVRLGQLLCNVVLETNLLYNIESHDLKDLFENEFQFFA